MPEIIDPNKIEQWISRVRSGRGETEPGLGRLFKKLRVGLAWLTWGYLLVGFVLIVLAKWCGEKQWLVGTLLYLPPAAALLPLFILTPLCLLFRRKLCWVHVAVVLMVFTFYLRPHFSSASTAAGRKIRVVTNNVGQRNPSSVTPFIRKEDPDIVAFQEARYRDRFLKKEYPGRFVSVHDEFALVSKWPIRSVGFVPGLFSHYGYAVAWFEVDMDGKSLIVYNVHLPTPRRDFVKMRGSGFLASLARGEGIYSSKTRDEYSESMQKRVEEGEKLADFLSKETRPFLVLGDFNMPDTGYLHRFFDARLTDVFAAKGNGYGLTFPGFTRNPLSLFGPWLRIDYIFCNQAWRPLRCEVEGRQNAQHLAIVADLEWVSDK